MVCMQTNEDRNMLGDFLREMFATLFFTIICGLTSDNPRDVLIPALAIGFGSAVLVESERAHMNPIISMAIAICDPTMGWTALFLRVLAQLIGCIFGGLIAVDGLRDVRLEFSVGVFSGVDRALAFELFFAFILVLVVLRTRKLKSGAFSHGLCYTMTVLAGDLIFSGNSLINPATAIGLMLGSSSYDSSTSESYLWIYIVAPIVGSMLASMFFQFTEFLFDEDDEEDSTYYTDEYTSEGVVKGTQVTRLADHRSSYAPAPGSQRRQDAPAPGAQRREQAPAASVQRSVKPGGGAQGPAPGMPMPATRGRVTPGNNGRGQVPVVNAFHQRSVARSGQQGYVPQPRGQHIELAQSARPNRGAPNAVPNRGAPNAVRYRDTHQEI